MGRQGSLSCTQAHTRAHTHTHTHTHTLTHTNTHTQTHTHTRTHTQTHTHANTHTRKHTHTHTHSRIHTHTQNELKEYDKDILKDLSKIWQTVHDIRDTQKEVKEEQTIQFLEDTTLSPPLSPASTTPSPEPFLASDGQRYRTGTLELLSRAPPHLKRKNDDKVLEEFFGSEQVDRLNDFKMTVTTEEEETDSASDGVGDVKLRRNGQKKLKIPINPNSGPIDRNRMSYDVASEMEQLRAKIQQKAKMELEDLDKKFSPKLTHPSFDLIGASSHSRQGSLDSSIPPAAANSNPPVSQVHHSRQASLPVFFDPEMVKKSPSTHLKVPDHTVEDVPDSRSPTPPQNYLHIRQTSAGSSSSLGSGTFSPPLVSTTQQGHVTSPTHHVISQSGQQIKPFGTPPLIRSPQRLPQSHNPRPHSGKPTSQPREPYAHHAHSYSNPVSIHPNPLPSQFKSGPGYSTTTVKGTKRSSPDGSKQQSNGYSVSTGKPPLPNHTLQISRGSADVAQSDVKGVSRVGQLRKAPSGEKVAASPRMGRAPHPSSSAPPISSQGMGNSHQKLGTRLSEPGNLASFVANRNGAQVHPEEIEPYMTSNEVKGQMFKYTPYSDKLAKDKSKSLGPSGTSQNRQKSNLLPNEQTWC